MRPVLSVLLVLTLAGCGGGPPRKPTRPDEREEAPAGLRREKFEVRGVGDEWHDGLTMIDGLERQGGVEEVKRDERDGHFVVTYNPERTSRDQLVRLVKELGRDVGESWEPIFEER